MLWQLGWGPPPSQLPGGLGGGDSTQFQMWPDGVVVLAPGGQHGPCLHHGGNQRLVEGLIARPPAQATAGTGLYRQDGSADTAPLVWQFRSDDTPGARSVRHSHGHGHGRPHHAARRASPFFAEMSFYTAMSSIASAKSFLSLAFSSSSLRSRLACATSRPPNLAFHLWNVASLIP